MAEHLLSGEGPVTLVTTFRLRSGAPIDQFVELWTQVGRLMARRDGYVSSRLYHAIVGGETDEYIHIAEWTHAALLADARSDPEVRSVERELEPMLVDRRRVLCDAVTEIIRRPPQTPQPAH